jgi:hypothetical protein
MGIVAVAGTLASLLRPGPLHGQSAGSLQSVVRDCAKPCNIELKLIRTLGAPQDSILPVRNPNIIKDQWGGYYLSPTYEPGTIAQYAADGRFISVHGRRGGGLGEFSSYPLRLLLANDTLLVLDQVSVTLAALPGLAFVGRHQLPIEPSQAAYDDGVLYMNNPLTVTDTASPLIYRCTLDGTELPGFGRVRDWPVSGRPVWEGLRILARARGGGVWAASVNRYEIDRYAPDGTRMATLERRVSWFEPWSGYVRGEPITRPPRPRVASLQQDSSGLLWVVLLVADPNPPRPPTATGEQPITPDMDPGDYYDTVIEVIDPERLVVVGSSRVSEYLRPVGNALEFHHAVEQANGALSQRILQPILTTSRR